MKVSSLPVGKYTLGGMIIKILKGDSNKKNRMIEIMGHCSIISHVEEVEGGWKVTCELKTRNKKEIKVKSFQGTIIPYQKDGCA